MGSKLKPGNFDCYANALSDEPMFILLARDSHAPDLVDAWAADRMRAILLGFRPKSDLPMIDEAQQCAKSMREWRKENDGKWRMADPIKILSMYLTDSTRVVQTSIALQVGESPPARPDGDALLLCPFCGESAMTGRAEGEKMMVLCANGHCKAKPWVIGHDPVDAGERWNTRATSPARDAAEGAGVLRHHANETLEEQEYLLSKAAPPKPAPDAVRDCDVETVQTLLDLLNPLHGELDRQTYDAKVAMDFDMPPDYAHDDVSITAQMERDLTQAVLILENRKQAALAATVPPADGAILEATPAQHIDRPKGEPAKFVRNGKLETCRCLDCRALSPPATGAAEPAAWQRSGIECPSCKGNGRVGVFACNSCGATGRIESLAFPPVRGDREMPDDATHLRRPEYIAAWLFDRMATMPVWLIEKYKSIPLPEKMIGHYATAVDGEFWRWFDPAKFEEMFVPRSTRCG